MYLITLFFVVVLHEYGHALTAKKYGIQTKDILLSPIGGIARMVKFPEEPIKEFYIAIAGPMVNLVLAIFTAVLLLICGIDLIPTRDPFYLILTWWGALQMFLVINVVLFAFNLIPAFPMDGGRVLRALLSTKLGKYKATNVASYIGQSLAIGFFVFGLLQQQFVLLFIGIFIFLQAYAERKVIRTEHRMKNTTAKDIVRTHFSKVNGAVVIDDFIKENQESQESAFLVVDDQQQAIGVFPKIYLEEIMRQQRTHESLNQWIESHIEYIQADLDIDQIFKLMQTKKLSLVVVHDGEEMIGVIDRALIKQFAT